MRWPLVLISAALLLGLQQAVAPQLALGQTAAAPSFLVPLIVFVALFAPPMAAMWTGLLIGLAVDLTSIWGPRELVVAGPHALGYLIGVYFVLTVRGLMYRRNPLTLLVLSIIACMFAEVFVVAVHSIRGIYSDAYAFHGLSQLGQRLIGSVYTGGVGLLMAFVLFPMMPLFGFHDQRERRFGARK